uniref:PAX-interacting protein 1 n=1 Tax=Triatoma infestans TaxID=30076 RepID=A0A170VV90_TRIIF
MYKMQRSLKLLCCLSTCKYIVDHKWLIDSFTSNQFLDEKPYLIEDNEL